MYNIVTPAPGITLIHGNSREVLTDLANEGTLADVVASDPPFGIAYQSEGHPPIDEDEDPIAIADWSIPAMARLMKNNTRMFLFTRDDVAQAWKFAMRANGLRVQPQHIIWDKVHASGKGDACSTFRVRYEPIIVAHKGHPTLRLWTDTHGRHFPNEPGKVVRRDEGMWRYPVPKDKLSSRHPTPKSALMFERAILPSTAPGGLVLDPFMGGAPVGVAAFWTGRKYIGVEKNPEYFELAVENLQRAVMQRRLCENLERIAA